MRKPWEILEIVGKLMAARNTLDDAIQLMNQFAEQQQSPQKQSGKEEAAQQLAIPAVRSDDSGALLDMKAAAAYLGVSPSFVKNIYRKSIPYVLLGTGMKKLRIRFRRCDLDVWILKHRVGR